jgi:hypothetical protein
VEKQENAGKRHEEGRAKVGNRQEKDSKSRKKAEKAGKRHEKGRKKE